MLNTTRYLLAMFVCLAMFTGCQAHRLPQGVHPEAQPVGGGTFFKFDAPRDGVLYLIDTNDNSLFASSTMEAGEEVTFGEDLDEEVLMMLGMRTYGPGFVITAEENEDEAIAMLETIEMPIFALYFATLEAMEIAPDGDD